MSDGSEIIKQNKGFSPVPLVYKGSSGEAGSGNGGAGSLFRGKRWLCTIYHVRVTAIVFLS